MPSALETQALFRTYFESQESVPTATPLVLPIGGTRGFVVILNGGTATYQACDAAGTAVAGSASHAAVSEAIVETCWPFVKITATTQPCIVARV